MSDLLTEGADRWRTAQETVGWMARGQWVWSCHQDLHTCIGCLTTAAIPGGQAGHGDGYTWLKMAKTGCDWQRDSRRFPSRRQEGSGAGPAAVRRDGRWHGACPGSPLNRREHRGPGGGTHRTEMCHPPGISEAGSSHRRQKGIDHETTIVRVQRPGGGPGRAHAGRDGDGGRERGAVQRPVERGHCAGDMPGSQRQLYRPVWEGEATPRGLSR